MPELLIMRHAKADWGTGLVDDRERPLARLGVTAAKRMGRAIAAIGCRPDLVLSSPAVRAKATAETAHRAGRWDGELRVVQSFYGGDWSDVIAAVHEHGDGHERLLVVGHEPTWSALIGVLCGGRVAMPTAAVACVAAIGSSWDAVGPGCGELLWHLTPQVVKTLR